MGAKVMVVGSGGREHALGWKLSESDKVDEVIYATGNPGTEEGKGRNVSIDGSKKENFSALYDLVKSEGIDMVVVGPEVPLSLGIVNYFNSKGYNRILGPIEESSKLESDKFLSYEIMDSLRIPQAKSVLCNGVMRAGEAIEQIASEKGVVIKARGLTGGKGVTVCNSKEEALEEIVNHSEKYGPDVLIAERLFGEEFSVFGISDGGRVIPFGIALQDFKRLYEGDKGPNTGGMGAYGPAPFVSRDMIKHIADKMMTPIVKKMGYKGILYAGMMMTERGPKVLEWNIRFGDPECQPLMMMLEDDLYKTLSLSLDGKLDREMIEVKEGAACCFVMASSGYPGKPDTGYEITGIDKANKIKGVKVFHAGTGKKDGKLINAGGRVLGVTGYSPSGISEARDLAYEGVKLIDFEGSRVRRDIAEKIIRREEVWN